MRLRLLSLALAALPFSVASADATPFRIPVRHADPWMVKAMLEGIPVRSPEMSAMPGFQGLGQATNAAVAFLQNGKLVVNPTDNSLWYFPNRDRP